VNVDGKEFLFTVNAKSYILGDMQCNLKKINHKSDQSVNGAWEQSM